jgi:hypothetical protein
MSENPKTISRLALYKKIWETPITRLSKEYGLSDVGFAKICKKHNIPRPPRGYWAQKESGQQVQKMPLPKRSPDEIIEIIPYRSNQVTSAVDPVILQKIGKYPSSVVPKSLRNPHPLIQQSQQSRILIRSRKSE